MANNQKVSEKIKTLMEEISLYWNQPRPGEYVCYKELALFSLGWTAQYFATSFTFGFGVGNEFTGMTLGMTNRELLVMSYVCQFIGYATTAVVSWLIDNLRSPEGKYRVYIKLAVPSMILSLIALWFPYEQVRDGISRYLMIGALFVIMQVQSFVQNMFIKGVQNMVHVITPNTQERAKIMAVTSVIYSIAPTIMNIYIPLMVDVLPINSNKYTMTFWRGTYTPLVLFAPLALFTYYGTQERLIIPKTRITKMSFANSIRSLAYNRIFWIKLLDGWNDFLEGAKGDVWNMLVYRAHITSSTTYGIMNTLCHNSQLWAMLFAPFFIRKFGKKKIKIFSNAIQIFLIAGIGVSYKWKYAIVPLFIINYINRFLSCTEVIDKAIDSDMRDDQQYLSGERIDGSFEMVRSYANSFVGLFTGLFIPWVYKKCGFDGSDYTVLDVYLDYNPDLPLAQQKKNPNCVLYSMLDVLIAISVFGAFIDVLPWFLYDVTETGQKSMIRVIRLRTLIEDHGSEEADTANFIEGCEAVINARKCEGAEKAKIPKQALKEAKLLPKNTEEEKQIRKEKIRECKKAIMQTEDNNEEIEISKFVLFELGRFNTEFGRKQLELDKFIVSGGDTKFYENYEKAVEMANQLPRSDVKEEKVWRKQAIRNARALKRSTKKAYKFYENGEIFFDPAELDKAYDLPDDTKEQRKIRNQAMRAASKAQNRYSAAAAPYLTSLRNVKLAEGYADIDNILAEYPELKRIDKEKKDKEMAEVKRAADERFADMEKRRAMKKIKKNK